MSQPPMRRQLDYSMFGSILIHYTLSFALFSVFLFSLFFKFATFLVMWFISLWLLLLTAYLYIYMYSIICGLYNQLIMSFMTKEIGKLKQKKIFIFYFNFEWKKRQVQERRSPIIATTNSYNTIIRIFLHIVSYLF